MSVEAQLAFSKGSMHTQSQLMVICCDTPQRLDHFLKMEMTDGDTTEAHRCLSRSGPKAVSPHMSLRLLF